MQIIYSELLGIPASIETGMVDKNVNFYDETNRMDYGKANEYKKFHNAYDAEGGDCSFYKDTNKDTNGDNYIPCAHLSMEVWFPNGELTEAQNLGKAEQLQFNGQIGHQGWHITQFSIKRDPSLGNHFGMRGETNRQKSLLVPLSFLPHGSTIVLSFLHRIVLKMMV